MMEDVIRAGSDGTLHDIWFQHGHFAMSCLPVLYPYPLPARRENTRFVPPLQGVRYHPTPRPQYACCSTYRSRRNFHCCNYRVDLVSWTRDAHVVLVLLTKPLVSQQVNAYFEVAEFPKSAFPKSATTMLTGGITWTTS